MIDAYLDDDHVRVSDVRGGVYFPSQDQNNIKILNESYIRNQTTKISDHVCDHNK